MAARLHVIIDAVTNSLNKGIRNAKKRLTEFSNTVKKTNKDISKSTAKASEGKKDGFMSAGWFAQRARWFVQLRAFWVIWQQLSKAISGAFEFEQEMANVRAITQATNAQFELLREKALEVGKTTRFSAAEAAEGMVVMSQAGLSVVEILQSITNVANLATATMFDFQKTASLTVTIMRAWNLTARDTQSITDVLATSINRTKLNMEALATGFNFLAGIAPQLNLTISETTALMGVLANRGLSASTASTSLRAIMAALLNPTDKFKRVLKEVGLTLADVDPKIHEFSTILETLRKSGFGVAEAFRAFRRRAAAGAAVAISASAEVKELSEGMDQLGRAAQMAEIQLDTVEGQMKQFEDNMIAAADTIVKNLDPAIKLMIKGMKGLFVSSINMLAPLADLVGEWSRLAELSVAFARGGQMGMGTLEMKRDLIEMNSQLKTFEDTQQDLIQDGNKLRNNRKELLTIAKDAVIAEEAGQSNDFIRIATKLAVQRNLITEKQSETVRDIVGAEAQYFALEKLINAEVERRLRLNSQDFKIAQQKASTFENRIKTVVNVEGKELAKAVLLGKKELDLEKAKTEEVKERITAMQALGKAVKTVVFQGALGGMFSGSGDPRSKKDEEARAKKQKALNLQVDRFYQIIRLGGPNAVELIEELGGEYAILIQAIKEAGSSQEVFKTMDRIVKEQSKGLEISKKTQKSYESQLGEVTKFTSAFKKTNTQQIKVLKDANLLLAAEKALLDFKIKQLKKQNESGEFDKQIIALAYEKNAVEGKITENKKKIVKLDADSSEARLKALDITQKISDANRDLLLSDLTRKEALRTIAFLRRQEKLELIEINKQNTIAELRGRSSTQGLKDEQSILKLKEQTLINELHSMKTSSEAASFTKKIEETEDALLSLSAQRTINLEKQRLATSAIARMQASINANPLNFKDAAEFFNAEGGIIDTMLGAGGEGLDVALTDIANLWGEQRAEVAGLEQELEGLNTQYQKALSEGNIEKARKLEQQMANIRKRVDDLNNPLKNLANTFKQFAVTVLQELQKVLIKMLVVKLIGMALGMFTGGGLPMGAPGPVLGSGGVVPGGTFKNFRKFAAGGVTNGVGAAILGDNPSGKELVIPSENIENNKVSGRVQDGRQPINIINILTQEDIARAMAGAAGQKTIINTIGKDIGKRGPTFRAIHS